MSYLKRSHVSHKSRPRSRKRDRNRPWFRMLDPLEYRQLLTVDLTGSFQAFSPTTVTSGGTEPVTLVVHNLGTTTGLGTLHINFYAALDGTPFDPDTATLLKPFSASLAVGAGGQQTINTTLPISPALAAGNYDIFAVLDPNHNFADTNTSNNLVQSSILAVTQSNVDLVPSFGTANIPATIIAGTPVTSSVQIILTNDGSVAIPAGVTIAAEVVARPASGPDIVINKSPISINVGSLAPNGTRTTTVSLVYPASMPPGPYQIVVKADTGNDLAETNETNNEATLANTTLSVTTPFTDLGLTFDPHTTLPSGTITSDGATKIPLKLDIVNNGNVTIAAGVSGTINIVAHDVDDDTDVALQSFAVALNGIASAKTRTLTLSPFLTLGMPAGNYTLEATLVTAIPTDLLTNNSASTADIGLSPLMVTRGFADISDTIVSDTLPPATLVGTAKKASVKVSLINLGNVAIPAGHQVNVVVALRPVDAGDATTDIPIGTMNAQSIAGLAANGGKKTISVAVTVPINAPSGDYNIVAKIAPVQPLGGDLLVNNEALGNPLTIGPRFTDLSIVTAAESFAANVVSGAQGNATFTLENLGNVNDTDGVTVKIYANTTPDNIANRVLVGSKTFFVNLASGGVTAKQSILVNLPAQATTTTYTLSMEITPSLPDNTSNNSFSPLGVVTVAPAFVDLDFKTATQSFSANELNGETGTASFQIENDGNIPDNSQFKITYYASPSDPTTPGVIPVGAVQIGTRTVGLNLGVGGASSLLTMPLTLPTVQSDTAYVILAQVSIVAPGLNDSNLDNNITVPDLGSVLVSHFTPVFPAANGDTLTFTVTSTSTQSGITNQRGNFVTNKGVKGTYLMTNGGPLDVFLTLNFNNSPITYSAKLNFDANPFLFGGNTIAFSFDSTSNLGSALFSNIINTTYFKIA